MSVCMTGAKITDVCLKVTPALPLLTVSEQPPLLNSYQSKGLMMSSNSGK